MLFYSQTMADDPRSVSENVSRNSLPLPGNAATDDLVVWLEAYFQLATADASQAVQRRDVGRFLAFMQDEVGHTRRPAWTPRLSRAFVNALRATLTEHGGRRWSDPTINRILAHLKTFAAWVHRQQPLPLGSPLANLATPHHAFGAGPAAGAHPGRAAAAARCRRSAGRYRRPVA